MVYELDFIAESIEKFNSADTNNRFIEVEKFIDKK
jgi:hypothetical protein